MAKSKTIRVSEEELALIKAMREGATKTQDAAATDTPKTVTQIQTELADAFVSAIERTRPPEKKTVANRKKNAPWLPKDGSPRAKMKRVYYQQGIPIERVSNEVIVLLNQIKPGRYCEGWITVTLRKDKGIDISYPVKTNAQRLKLINQYGLTSLEAILKRIIDEREYPGKYRKPEDADLYELDN